MQSRLKKYATTEAHVPFPMRGTGDQDSNWLSDEAYQTYSIRAGTAPWQEYLRRQVLLYRFRQLNPDNALNKAIWQPRLQKRYLKAEVEKVEMKKRQQHASRGGGGRKRERNEDQDLTGMDVGDDDYDDRDRGRPFSSRALESSATTLELLPSTLVLGPVAKRRNSSLTLEQHRQYLALEKKLRMYQDGVKEARPLTSDEGSTLEKLRGKVLAEQEKYRTEMKKWVEGSLAPYKSLDKLIASHVDAYFSALKDMQKTSLLRTTATTDNKPSDDQQQQQRSFWPQQSSQPTPTFAPSGPDQVAPPVVALPPFLGLVCSARKPRPLTIPSKLPADLLAGRDASSQLRPPRLAPDLQEWMTNEDADVIVDLRTLLAMADPSTSWAIPFDNIPKADDHDGSSSAAAKGTLVTVIRPPLLPSVMTLRDVAEVYFRRLINETTVTGPTKTRDSGDANNDEEEATMAYESWKLGEHIKAMVGSERVKIIQQQEAGGGAEREEVVKAEEAILEVDVDYCLDFSEEGERSPQGMIRRMLYSWAAVSCPVYRATVDGKTAQLAKVEEVHFTTSPMETQPQGEMLTFLRSMISAMMRAGEGRFIAQLHADRQQVVIFKQPEQGPGGEAAGGGGVGGLDVVAYVDGSGQRDRSAWSSFTEWKWVYTGDHIPHTFIPRIG